MGRRDKGQAHKMHWEVNFPQPHIIFMHDTPSKAYLIENKGPLVMVVSG
jgi:hypothetical protein